MFRSKTVFVVGAGASADLNLRTGPRLGEMLGQSLNLAATPDQDLVAILGECASTRGVDVSVLFSRCSQIADGMVHGQSIDEYLNAHAGDELLATCGKIGIAYW